MSYARDEEGTEGSPRRIDLLENVFLQKEDRKLLRQVFGLLCGEALSPDVDIEWIPVTREQIRQRCLGFGGAAVGCSRHEAPVRGRKPTGHISGRRVHVAHSTVLSRSIPVRIFYSGRSCIFESSRG